MNIPFRVDRTIYPFQSRFLQVEGGRMHYVDEGEGPPVVLVHGTPVWSFVYRQLIGALSQTHRVVAMDHLGFGLSDKPADGAYRPEDHARRLHALIEHLELKEMVLVVHDFGGPIGLSYAVEHPANVRGLVLFNTWMWSLADTPAERLSRFLSGAIGRWLYRRLNVSPRYLVPMLFADRARLTPEIHRHYIEAFPSPAERQAPWVFARELIGSTAWYEDLWSRREAIADIPALVLWGMRDSAFKPDALARWRTALRRVRVVEFADAGHFVQEEAPEAAASEIRRFLAELEPSRVDV
jgi:pimeloyl-ACP methyl ester carboxylesterase